MKVKCQCGKNATDLVDIPLRGWGYVARVVADVRGYLVASDWKQVPMCEDCAKLEVAKSTQY